MFNELQALPQVFRNCRVILCFHRVVIGFIDKRDKMSRSDVDDNGVIKGKISSNVEEDEFWLKHGKKIMSKQFEGFDETAKFMITTCAGLIAVDFGLLIAFSGPKGLRADIGSLKGFKEERDVDS
jgi:hypothetical protein